ncbi:putative FMN flavoprotein [Rhodococcus rhodnii LMG 5362]|uniref:Putative FMN flavoprotein n=1 Tax=Rhodococcus rhodnii LMG 5362 TaxID=1273125 RepID=R7WSW0_9NOCA|nr:putative FMN flavoprotein [Rhodococcus rhodnii LMG 5362]
MRDLAAAQYVLLTTFRKDGTPVDTPLWVAPDGDAAVVWTPRESWKVRRIRHTPRVTVAECDVRGNVRGDSVSAHAELLDDAGSDHVRTLVARKYGILGRLTLFGSRVRRGRTGTIGIRITGEPAA